MRSIALISLLTACLILTIAVPHSVQASLFSSTNPDKVMDDSNVKPPSLESLQNIPSSMKAADNKMPIDIRKDALKEAAMSYGARGGLAFRTWHIRKTLEQRASYLDKIFNFKALLITAPSGFLIEPPIISESIDNMLIEQGGQNAAVADTMFNINKNVEIVSAARNWRQYLDRDWGAIDEPPEVLKPNNAEERAIWKEFVAKGWKEGETQADEVFEMDLNALLADFNGMVRYRKLLAQNMITTPFTQQLDRGVTGNGTSMRVGDRAVSITEIPQLVTGSDIWQPASQ
jgi:defect in organelle trafficking protein DotC